MIEWFFISAVIIVCLSAVNKLLDYKPKERQPCEVNVIIKDPKTGETETTTGMFIPHNK